MTKRHFEHAAAMVKAIKAGQWTNDLPDWAPLRVDGLIEVDTESDGNFDANLLRAVWTAEAFVILFTAFNPLFDVNRFLIACRLKDKPAKGKR